MLFPGTHASHPQVIRLVHLYESGPHLTAMMDGSTGCRVLHLLSRSARAPPTECEPKESLSHCWRDLVLTLSTDKRLPDDVMLVVCESDCTFHIKEAQIAEACTKFLFSCTLEQIQGTYGVDLTKHEKVPVRPTPWMTCVVKIANHVYRKHHSSCFWAGWWCPQVYDGKAACGTYKPGLMARPAGGSQMIILRRESVMELKAIFEEDTLKAETAGKPSWMPGHVDFYLMSKIRDACHNKGLRKTWNLTRATYCVPSLVHFTAHVSGCSWKERTRMNTWHHYYYCPKGPMYFKAYQQKHNPDTFGVQIWWMDGLLNTNKDDAFAPRNEKRYLASTLRDPMQDVKPWLTAVTKEMAYYTGHGTLLPFYGQSLTELPRRSDIRPQQFGQMRKDHLTPETRVWLEHRVDSGDEDTPLVGRETKEVSKTARTNRSVQTQLHGVRLRNVVRMGTEAGSVIRLSRLHLPGEQQPAVSFACRVYTVGRGRGCSVIRLSRLRSVQNLCVHACCCRCEQVHGLYCFILCLQRRNLAWRCQCRSRTPLCRRLYWHLTAHKRCPTGGCVAVPPSGHCGHGGTCDGALLPVRPTPRFPPRLRRLGVVLGL